MDYKKIYDKIIENRNKVSVMKDMFVKLASLYDKNEYMSVEYRNNKIYIKINGHNEFVFVYEECVDYDSIVSTVENSECFKNKDILFSKRYKKIYDYLKEHFNFLYCNDTWIRMDDYNYANIDRDGSIKLCFNYNDYNIQKDSVTNMLDDIKNIVSEETRTEAINLCKESIDFIETNKMYNLTYDNIYIEGLCDVFSTIIIDELGNKYQLPTSQVFKVEGTKELNIKNILYMNQEMTIGSYDFKNLFQNNKGINIAFSFKNLYKSKKLECFDFVAVTYLLEESAISRNSFVNKIIYNDEMIGQLVKTTNDSIENIIKDIMQQIKKGIYAFVLNDEITTSCIDGKKQPWLIKDFCEAFSKATGYNVINIK